MSRQKTLLITGSSRGLGLFLCQYFLEAGHKIIGCSRSESSIEHPNYRHFSLDICDEPAVKAMFISIRKEYGVLDGLINNAGAASMNAMALTPLASVRALMELNYLASFNCSQKALGLLKRAPHPRIVNMTSVAVPLALEGEAAYAAAKSSVEALTRVMAFELSSFGITCNALGPTPIATDLIKGVPEDKIAALVQRQAIKKMAKPQDVANVIEFYLSDASDQITGQIMYLGGIR